MTEPDYYISGGLSPLKAFKEGLLTKEEYKGFLKGNIIKYTIRAGEKDDALLDIVKAMDYLHYLHEALKEDEDNEIRFKENVKSENITMNDLKRNIENFKKEYGID